MTIFLGIVLLISAIIYMLSEDPRIEKGSLLVFLMVMLVAIINTMST